MNRRRLLTLLTIPALAVLGSAAYVQARSARNPYYEGPVTDHFDGLRFSNPPGGPAMKPFTEFLKWQVSGEREDWPGAYPSPFTFIGPQRVNPPGIAFADLPPIDAVLVTHNHYDHLDRATVSRLWHAHRPRIIAPLGNDAVIRELDDSIAVETYDWGQSVALSEAVTVHMEPSYHWSARGLTDRRMALWSAYVL